MKVLEKATMSNGTKIQLEDWSDVYPDIYGFMIGAYPIAQRTSQYGWIQGGTEFRLSISRYSSNEEVLKDFESLKTGEKQLEDLADRFHDGKKDMWLLGMAV